MSDVAVNACWLVGGIGSVMVVAALIARTIKRLIRLSDETVRDPWFRRNDTSGLSRAIFWLRPGLVLTLVAAAAALLLAIVT